MVWQYHKKMTREELKAEISGIAESLKKQGKKHLAKCIEENWDKTAREYSRELNTYHPTKGMEKEMFLAFDIELARLDTPENLKKKILASLQSRRVLQTAPHLGVTEGPRMLSINWLGSLAVPEAEFYVVGMFSGIPFSNNFRPGRINRKESSINLFPSSLQDGLVYRSLIQEKLVDTVKDLPPEISKFLTETRVGESYTKWALWGCQNIERKILGKENLIFLDINEVVSNYLVQVLKNKEHIFYKIFFEQKTREEFTKMFPNEIMFYFPATEGKYEQMENVFFNNGALESKHQRIAIDNDEDLIEELKNSRLCPALITGFMSLAFLNQFKCLGSFAQVEYLPAYQKKLAQLESLKGQGIESVPTANLTTGTLGENLYPVDILLGEKFSPKSETLFGELLIPIKEVLLKSYFTGDEKEK